MAMFMGLQGLMGTLKSKLRRPFKSTKSKDYDRVEKTDSMRAEITRRKARKLIEQTLKVADSPKKRSVSI